MFSAAAAWADGAQPTTDQAEAQFVAHINQERTSRGLGPLAVAGDLVSLARQHSADMAAAGRIYHDPNIRSEVQDWQELGDNVGSGATVDNIHTGFMNSQIHRDEILQPDYTQVGVGCYWAGNVLYVTEIFRLPVTHTASAAPSSPGATRIVVHIARPVAAQARAAATSTPPAPATAAPTTVPPVPVPTTAAPHVTVLPWPSATALDARKVSRSTPTRPHVPTAALVAAVVLAIAAGFEVQALRRRNI